jgi:glutaconate CoA-transferase subunit B
VSRLITTLGVFDFEPTSKAMRIRSLHDGVSLEEVRDNTGFDLVVPRTLARTTPPDSEEMFVLRRLVDTSGVLARKFPWPKAA